LPALESVFQFGHAGVDLFFVISGFVILFIHFDDVGRLRRIQRYLERRLTRVLPAYWVALALTGVLSAAGGHGARLMTIAWAVLPVPISAEPLLGVAWTLQYEFVFYLVFAVLILNRVAGMALMLGWLAIIVVGAVRADPIAVPGAFYGLFNLEFFAGMAVAYRLRRGGLPQYKLVLAAGVVLFAFTAMAEDLRWIDGYSAFARLAYGLPSTLLVLGSAEASRLGVVRLPAMLRTLGSASYSLYLFHFLLIGIAWKLWLAVGLDKAVPPEIAFVLFAATAIIGGIVISRLVEYPLMRLIRNALRRAAPHEAERRRGSGLDQPDPRPSG